MTTKFLKDSSWEFSRLISTAVISSAHEEQGACEALRLASTSVDRTGDIAVTFYHLEYFYGIKRDKCGESLVRSSIYDPH